MTLCTTDYSIIAPLILYNQVTGVFTWKISWGGYAKPGRVAGSINRHGYRRIAYKGVEYRAHRLAFVLMGEVPPEIIDHINRDKADNRWANLRAATHIQNSYNSENYSHNTSGYRGVSFKKSRNKWYAYVKHNGKQLSCGYFDTAEEADAAASLKREELLNERRTEGIAQHSQ